MEAIAQNRTLRERVEHSVEPNSLILGATDGCSLGVSVFEPVSAVAGTLVIHGATATPQRYYRRFAQFLAEHAVRVVTYDYRGIGRSRPASLRGYRATMTQWADVDARSVHRYVGDRYGTQSVAILGHSFGGQLVGLIDEAREVCGAIFVGAQLLARCLRGSLTPRGPSRAPCRGGERRRSSRRLARRGPRSHG